MFSVLLYMWCSLAFLTLLLWFIVDYYGIWCNCNNVSLYFDFYQLFPLYLFVLGLPYLSFFPCKKLTSVFRRPTKMWMLYSIFFFFFFRKVCVFISYSSIEWTLTSLTFLDISLERSMFYVVECTLCNFNSVCHACAIYIYFYRCLV